MKKKNINNTSKDKRTSKPPVERVYAELVPSEDNKIIEKIKTKSLSEEEAKIMAKVIQRMMDT